MISREIKFTKSTQQETFISAMKISENPTKTSSISNIKVLTNAIFKGSLKDKSCPHCWNLNHTNFCWGISF